MSGVYIVDMHRIEVVPSVDVVHVKHEYSHKYKKLKSVIDYHFNSNDIGIKQVILHKRLEERGWQNQEIELYNQSTAIFYP